MTNQQNLNECDVLEKDTQSSAHHTETYPDFVSKSMEHYYGERVKKSWDGGHILQGKTPGPDSLIFSSNDYLHISKHPQLINTQITAMQKYGNGQMQSSVFLSDTSQLLSDCEQEFSSFLNYPSSLLTQSGWSANIGLIQALAKRDIPVYLDFYTHMSFWSGVKSTGAKPIPFAHNSIESLNKKLERHGPGIIAVDSLYSTIGTISPLKEYARLAKKYDCLLIVDESHSLGVFGPEGRGLVAQLSLTNQVDLITASLAKALSGRGGVIAGKKRLIEYLRYSSLPSIFSSALLPHDLAGFTTSINIIKKEEWRRTKLHANAHYLRETLSNHKINLGGSQSQIIPLLAGNETNTIWLRNELESEAIFGAVFCAPATPKNKSLIRLSVSANHELDHLEKVINCLSKLAKLKPELPFFKKGLLDL